MTLVVGSGNGEERAPEPGEHHRRSRGWRLLGSPLVLIPLVIVAVAVAPAVPGWLATPPAFRAGVTVGSSRPYEPGTSFHVHLADGELPDVTVHDVEVILAEGSAPAATAVSVCRPQPGGNGVLLVSGELSEWCASVLPVEGLDLGGFGPDDSLVLTVVPLEAGPLEVTGVALTHDQGLRRPTQVIDVSFKTEGR